MLDLYLADHWLVADADTLASFPCLAKSLGRLCMRAA